MTAYIALIHKDPGSDYGVSFPDFPGCISAGATLDEARAMAAEALALHIDGMTEDGEPIPAPSALDEVMADSLSREAVAVLIDAPSATTRAVRVNVTLPVDVLEAVDAQAAEQGLTRSAFLAQVARKQLPA